jgi:predicted RND superfamily exporter protein
MKRGILPRLLPLALARFGNRHPWPVLALALAACVLACVMASRVDIETDILSLVPADNKVVQDFKTTVERFGSVDTLLVVIRLEPGADLDRCCFAEPLASERGAGSR